MDEVDGCDLGGVSEVIQMIKFTKVPIVCTCNDRWHQKLRPLIKHVEDVRFTRPPCNIVANFICDRILAREGVSLSKQLLQDIIQKGGSDIRNILNNLQMWCLKKNVLDQRTLAASAAASAKNTEIGLFQAPEPFLRVQQVGANGQRGTAGTSPSELLGMYYNSELVDQFIQENYIHYQPENRDWLGAVAQAADSISAADTLNKIMYQGQNWSVSNGYVLQSSIIPGACVRGHYQSFKQGQQAHFDRQNPIKFPSWLGNNSTTNKNLRLLAVLTKELTHPVEGASGGSTDVALDYIPLGIRAPLTAPLASSGKEGIASVIAFMDQYRLMREDWDFVQEVSVYQHLEHPGKSKAVSGIETAVKSAFTREFNKTHKTEGMRSVIGRTGAGVAETNEDDDEEVATGEDEPASPVAIAPAKAAPKKPPAKRQPKEGAGGAAPPAKKAPAKRPRDLTFVE
ncbi:replication factor subunit 1, putative [Bodo saltans]|uniref:Replication factor subunit 1, putative n=1 Tax=Bodo saltans TaxID=75058 RepID=A0A0S4JPW9_BODSA|nr:replication factor subunit 1, putative [Bodo saltans]|eukprot:CUG91425.1 replication factor subunit 1, putative [Bodo saltans]